MRINLVITGFVVLTAAGLCQRAGAQESTQDLAAAAQNPVGAMYSLPFQNNIYGGAGPEHDATANVLNIQPVIPIGDWNIISRTIAPLPVGARVWSLPNGAVDRNINGVTYFAHGGAYYRPYYSGSSVYYQVVANPA